MLWRLRVVVVPVFVALFLSTVLAPPAAALSRRGLRPLLATTIVFVALFAALAAVLVLIVPPFVDQFGELGDATSTVLDDLREWFRTGPLDMADGDIDELVESAQDQISQRQGAIANGAIAGATVAAELPSAPSLTLVLTFFFVKDGERMIDFGLSQVRRETAEDLREIGRRGWRTLTGYFRGVTIDGVIEGVLIGGGLVVLGVPLALPLGVITFFGGYFPLVGAVVAGALAAAVALVTQGVVAALLIIAWALIVQNVVSNLIDPLVMSRTVKIHPVVVLVAVTAGGVLGGIVGAFVAVPLAAVVLEVVDYFHNVKNPRAAIPRRSTTTGTDPKARPTPTRTSLRRRPETASRARRARKEAVRTPSWMPRRPVRVPLRVRAMLAFGLVSLVLSGTLALITFTLVRTWIVEDREEAAMAQTYGNARLLRIRLRSADTDLTTLISSLPSSGADTVLLEQEGDWYSSSVGVDRASLPTALRDTVSEGEVARQIVAGPDGPQLAIGVPIPEVDARYFELVELDDTDNTLQILGTSLALGAAGAAVIGALTGAAVSGRVLRPLRRVSAVAQQVREGGPSARLEPSGDPDLDPLTESFNGMLDELEERARREARFASDVSHDLRGPLTALAAAISVVNRRRAQLPPEATQAIDALDEQVTAFNRLVVDLLEISRFEAGTAELDVREVGALEFVRAVLSEAHRDVPVVVPPGYSPRVVIDPRRVRQALGNLLENADRYGGGVTRVCVEPADDETVCIVVEDGGPGVDPADREAIFNRYERGRAHRDADLPKGTGLGLALSMQHVRLHGGTIRVEDAPGGGARFVIELPVATP